MYTRLIADIQAIIVSEIGNRLGMGPVAQLVEQYTYYLGSSPFQARADPYCSSLYVGASSGDLYSQLALCHRNTDPPKTFQW